MSERHKLELPSFEHLLSDIDRIMKADLTRDEKLLEICTHLRDAVPHYDWVGFYLVDPDASRELVLGPYAGEPTDHTRIAFGQGICGQAAETETTFIIQDVAQETNYLSCSPDVRSEIVVPLFRDGDEDSDIIGELDIDSHTLHPFTPADQAFLEKVCTKVATLF